MMALGVLLLMNIIIVLGVIIAQIQLYREHTGNKFFIINMTLGILLSLLVLTSLPTNYIAQRIGTIIVGALAVFAFYLKRQTDHTLLAKMMLSISVLANIVQLFI